MLSLADGPRVKHTFQIAEVMEFTTGTGSTGSAATAERPDTHRRSISSMRREAMFHTVARNETLWAISKRYRTSVKQLRAWNRLSPRDTLKAGQTLMVRPRAAATREASVAPYTMSSHVKSEDVLWTLAERFRVSTDEICGPALLARSPTHPRVNLHLDLSQQLPRASDS
jgi:nucleoid-associated protein YgaU